MNDKTREQIEAMKNQTIGVEIEMNNITREKAARKVAEAVDGGHAYDKLQEDEFECERRRKSTDKYRNEVYIECGARVEEGDHDNGNNGERNQIYAL
mgnify:CR=1 FL=1